MVFQLIPLASALLPLVADFAPSVTRFLVGDRKADSVERVTQAATKVAAAVQQVTGSPVNTPEEVAAARAKIAADPELQAKLTMALAQVDVELERIELERDKAYLEDVQNARARDIQRVQAGSGNIRANLMLISAFVAIVAIVALMVLKNDVNETVAGFVIGIGGMFARNIGSAFDFEFGSSRGSKNKEAILGGELQRAQQSVSDNVKTVSTVAQAAQSVQQVKDVAKALRSSIASS